MKRFFWKESDLAILKKLYSNTKTETVAAIIGIKVSQVYHKANDLGLKKHPEFIKRHARFQPGSTVGINTRFKKGNIPQNKGKKMKPEMYEKLKSTMFKKGCKPHNFKNSGYSRITKDGYIEVKQENGFKLLHRIVYENCYGPIPNGHNVQFKDGNKQNCTPENLYIINRKEQMIQNSFLNLPDEIIELIRLKARLTRKINQKTQEDGTK